MQDCIRKVLYVDVSLGFIYSEVARVSQIAERINLKVSSIVNPSHCAMDEVSMGVKVLEYKERGFNSSILTSDLLPTYRAIAAILLAYISFVQIMQGALSPES